MHIVVGASSGVGLELVKILSKKNTVIGISRTDSRYIDKNYQQILIDVKKDITLLNDKIKNNSIKSIIFTIGQYDDYDNVKFETEKILDLIKVNFLCIVNFINFLEKNNKFCKEAYISVCSSVTTFAQRDKQTFYSISKHSLDRYVESLRIYNNRNNINIYVNNFIIGVLEKPMKQSKKIPNKYFATSIKVVANFIAQNNLSKNKNFIFPKWWIVIKFVFLFLPKFLRSTLIK